MFVCVYIYVNHKNILFVQSFTVSESLFTYSVYVRVAFMFTFKDTITNIQNYCPQFMKGTITLLPTLAPP